MSKELETFKTPEQVDEAIQKIIDMYYNIELVHWSKNFKPEDHIIHQLNILKDLYQKGGPKEQF